MNAETPSRAPIIAHTVADLRALVAAWRRAGERIALVPTMGALHAGHGSLAELARSKAHRVIVSIFVNPTQFAPNEDFDAYPRTWATDIERLSAIGVDAVFNPSPREMYPDGFCTTVRLAGPATADLEDRFRPTHFEGVATVVAKLLTQSAPDIAIFGQKDFQQLAVIRQMARDLDLPVEIIGAPTIRDADGLAMSSRNAYLEPSERAVSAVLYRTMQDCATALRQGESVADVLARGRSAIIAAGFDLDYLELRHADTLAPILRYGDSAARLLVAAKIGKTRLIDNIQV